MAAGSGVARSLVEAPQSLGDAELEVLKELWEGGPTTVRACRPLTRTTATPP